MTGDRLRDAADSMAELVGPQSGLDMCLRIEIGGLGSLLVDLAPDNGRVRIGEGASDAVIALAPETFAALMSGAMDPQTAFRRGRLRISGDIAAAFAATRYLREQGIALAADREKAS